jgi:hypothetical protein
MEIAELGVYTPRSFPGPPASRVSLRALEQRVDELATAIDGSDQEPTPDARKGLEDAEKALEGTLARWRELKAAAGAK